MSHPLVKSLLTAVFLAEAAPQDCSSAGSRSQPPLIKLETKPLIEKGSPRVSVSLISTFRDDLAYDGYRGIYIIKDNDKGVEYLGISGIGISELGSHQRYSGKTTTTVQDER